METIHSYAFAYCSPRALAQAERLGLSENSKRTLMDPRRESSDAYMMVYVSDVDGQILMVGHKTLAEVQMLNPNSVSIFNRPEK